MLDLITECTNRTCDGATRREFLRIGALSLGGLSLTGLLAARARAAASGVRVKDTSVVMVFLTGGPSQIETFDPKMTAPGDVRSVTSELATSIPGVTFGGSFPKLARLAHKMAVVRSFTHDNSDHTDAVRRVSRGGNPTGGGMGSLLARLRGTTHRKTGIPTHVYLGQKETDPQFDKERLRLLEANGPGNLGAAYAPFEPLGNGPVHRNMNLNVPRSRLDDRRVLRRALDQLHRRLDRSDEMEALDEFEQQAFDLVVGKSKAAFDLSQEDPRLLQRYDTSGYNTALRVKSRPSTLGHQMLLASRLCEAGCGFVTIHNPGWDMHGGDTQFDMARGMNRLGRPLDHAVAAFLQDVEQRGLSERILHIITGEFGRTPKINSSGGRDHWPRLSTLALAGGGLRMGQIVGQSDSNAEAPQANPVTVENLLATVLHVLFEVPQLRLLPNAPRDITATVGGAEPIAELL